MFKTGSLLLASILAVALLAPPAPSQTRKIQIEDVYRDVIELRSFVKEMQRTADTRNAETKAALDQMNARFSSIDANLQKLGSSLDGIRVANEKSATDLQAARTALASL